MKLTNHDMLLVALHPYRGSDLSLSAMQKIVLNRFPEFNLGSLQPNDHSQLGNKNCCRCVGTNRQLFVNVGRATYHVI